MILESIKVFHHVNTFFLEKQNVLTYILKKVLQYCEVEQTHTIFKVEG